MLKYTNGTQAYNINQTQGLTSKIKTKQIEKKTQSAHHSLKQHKRNLKK